MAAQNRCAIPSCARAPAHAKYLMCFRHWSMVDHALQREIWRLYANGKRLPGHAEACARAVAAVREQITDRKAGQPKEAPA